MPLEPGDEIAHYRLVEKIGEGGMGVVWKALDTKLNRHVALKVLPHELTSDEERRLRFLREAQAAAALSHPNIAVVHEVGEHEGSPYIAMELLDGASLRARYAGKALGTREWLRLAVPIAEALAHAHKRGVVHRDLKPDNVMITDEGQVKILDFGLAKLAQREPADVPPGQGTDSRLDTISRELTRAGKVFGTVAYMSPEQARGESVDHRSDLFSLGVMLYEMAAGRLPFKRGSEVESLSATIAADPAPLSEISQGIPFEAERVVRKALEKEPERRYQDAADLAADLKNLLRDIDSGRASVPSGAAIRREAKAGPRWAKIAGLVTLGVVAAAALYWSVGRSGSGRKASAEDRSVAIMGFENVTNPADTDHLGRALMGLVTTDLAETGGLQIVSTAQVLAALKDAGADLSEGFTASVAPAAARKARADVMVVGQVTQAGGRLVVSAELVDVAAGSTLGSIKQEAASADDVFSLAGAIASYVRVQMGATTRTSSGERFDLAATLTSSSEAYKQYAAGEAAYQEADWEEAAARLTRAIEIDPTFALAHYRLGKTLSWQQMPGEAIDAWRRGLPYVDRLPERWRIVYRSVLAAHGGNAEQAYRDLAKLVSEKPDIPDAYYDLAEIMTHFDAYRDARRARELIEKTLELDPAFTVATLHLVESDVLTGDLEAAKKFHVRGLNQTAADFTVLLAEGKIQAALAEIDKAPLSYTFVRKIPAQMIAGDWSAARRTAELGEGLPAVLAGWRGISLAAQGRFEDALKGLNEAVAIGAREFDAYNKAVTAPPIDMDLVLTLRAMGRTKGAVARARDAVEEHPDYFACHYWLGRLLLESEQPDEAKRALSSLESVASKAPSPKGRFWVLLLGAEVSLTEGSASDAQARLDVILKMAVEYRDPALEANARARVAAALGDRPAAIQAYEQSLKPGVLFVSILPFNSIVAPIAVERPRTWLALGILEAEEGRTADARRHFEAVLEQWGTSDVPILEAADARRRLAALKP